MDLFLDEPNILKYEEIEETVGFVQSIDPVQVFGLIMFLILIGGIITGLIVRDLLKKGTYAFYVSDTGKETRLKMG